MTKMTDEERKESKRKSNKKFRESHPGYAQEYKQKHRKAAYDKAYYLKHKDDPEYKAKLREYDAKYRKKRLEAMTPEERKADTKKNTDYCRNYRENHRTEHREYMNDYMKTYYQKNPDQRAKRNVAARERYYTSRGLPVPPKKVPKKDI